MQPKRTSKEPHPFFKLSTWIIIIICSSCIAVGIYVFVSLPVGCHAFVSTMLACSAVRRVLVCTIGTSPLSMRWWVVDACTLFTTPIIVSARTCQQWQVPPWPWILRTRRVESRKSNLRVVWRGSQRVNYMCMLCCMYNVHCKIVVELWVEVGLNKKHNSIIIYLLCLIYYDKTLRSAIDRLKY